MDPRHDYGYRHSYGLDESNQANFFAVLRTISPITSNIADYTTTILTK